MGIKDASPCPLKEDILTPPKEKNKTKPGVKITLDKVRTLKLDLNAMAAFEEATGKSLTDGSFKSRNMSPKNLRAMLWACLVHEDDTLTEQQVGSMVTVSNIMEIAGKLNEAFEVAMPESGDKQTVPLAKKPRRG